MTHFVTRSLVQRLERMTGKQWGGTTSPTVNECLGGFIVMYSAFIDNPCINCLIPCGTLTEFRGIWGESPFCLLSVQRISNLVSPNFFPRSAASNLEVDKGIWAMVAATFWRSESYLCGDFAIPPRQLDNILLEKDLDARRIPFVGPHLSYTHPSTHSEPATSSALDHLVWSGDGTPVCKLAPLSLIHI